MTNHGARNQNRSVGGVLRRVWDLEFRDLVRWHRVGATVASVLPANALHTTRTLVLRLFGWRLGHGVILAATPRLLGPGAVHRRLDVGEGVYVNIGATWELGERIRIGNRVHLGQNVSLLTTSHQVGDPSCRAGALTRAPIELGAGCWIAAGATVHGGITVGEGAVVAAGCVVTRDVPPNCLFGGVPGRVVRSLEPDEHGPQVDPTAS